MAQFSAYLFFDGRCAEALRFYETALGAKIDGLMTFAEMPDRSQIPPGSESRVMHARLVLAGHELMASDSMPGEPAEPMSGFAISLDYPTAEEAHRVFARLAEGGQVRMPIAPTFWADAFGMAVDRFGAPWMVNGGMKPMG